MRLLAAEIKLQSLECISGPPCRRRALHSPYHSLSVPFECFIDISPKFFFHLPPSTLIEFCVGAPANTKKKNKYHKTGYIS